MKALFIAPEIVTVERGLFEFSKEVDVRSECKATVKINASARYTLYVNGKYICEGPCRSKSDIRYYETVDVDFVKGKNEIRAVVMHITDVMDYSSCFRLNKPMLIADCRIGDEHIVTDTSWKCEFVESNELKKANDLYDRIAFIPPFEHIKGKKKTVGVPVEEVGFFDFEGLEKSVYGIAKPVYLEPRPIPIIYPQAPVDLKIINKGEGFIELDAGEYTTDKVEFELKGGFEYKIL